MIGVAKVISDTEVNFYGTGGEEIYPSMDALVAAKGGVSKSVEDSEYSDLRATLATPQDEQGNVRPEPELSEGEPQPEEQQAAA